jgi:acyl-coenzyme A thioesterase PaaI-like protein
VEAQVIQIGKSVAFMEGKLMADNGAVLATASTTARLIEAAKAIRLPEPELQSAAWR